MSSIFTLVGSSLSSAASSSLSSARHGIYVAHASAQDMYSYLRHGSVLSATDLSASVFSGSPAPKVFLLVPDHHDRRASLHGLAKVARTSIPHAAADATAAAAAAAADVFLVATDANGFEPLMALAPNAGQMLDIKGLQERDFVHIAAATLGLKATIHRIIDVAPDAEIVLISQGVGATAASNLACGSAPAQFAQPAHVEYRPMLSRQEYRDNILADVRFSDRSYDHTAPWAAGPAHTSGLSARLSLKQCAENSDRTLDFCLADDAFCASGRTVDVTAGYFSNATIVQHAAHYIHSRLFGARVAVRDGTRPVPLPFLGPQAMDRIEFGAADVRGTVVGHRAKRAQSKSQSGGEGPVWVPGKEDDPALIKGSTPALEAEATTPVYGSTHWINPHMAVQTANATTTTTTHAALVTGTAGAVPTAAPGNWTLPVLGAVGNKTVTSAWVAAGQATGSESWTTTSAADAEYTEWLSSAATGSVYTSTAYTSTASGSTFSNTTNVTWVHAALATPTAVEGMAMGLLS